MQNEDSQQVDGKIAGGTPESTALTVRLMDKEWIVENAVGECMASGASRSEAIDLARQVSNRQEVSGITVLGNDGSVEETLNV
jgi:hypothetical protein